MKIEIQQDGTIILQKHFVSSEVEMLYCCGFTQCIHDGNVAFKAKIYTVSRESLWFILRNSFKYLFNDNYRQQANDLFSALKKFYSFYDMEFRQMASMKCNYINKLYKHQIECINLGVYRKNNIIALEQGLGKSIVAATISKVLDINRTLIVCPSVCKWNWYEELIVGWGFSPIEITVADSQKSINSFYEKYVIINYELLSKRTDALLSRSYGHIILDEAHYIKSESSNRHKAVASLIEKNKGAKISFLTGTPQKNTVIDFFAYLKLINHPLSSSKSKFKKRFIQYSFYDGKMKEVGVKNPLLLRELLSNVMIRKTKDECLNLPDKIYHKFLFEIGDYKDAYNDALKRILTGSHIAKNGNVNAAILTLNRISSISKAKHIQALANTIIDGGEKVVIFSLFKDTIASMKEYFKDKCVVIDGSIPTSKRQEIISRFKTDDSVSVFIGQTIAAGIGINLTNCSNVILCDLPFTHADLNQAIDRVHRIGAKKPPNIYFALCKATVDIRLFNIVTKKENDAALVVDGKEETKVYEDLKASLLKDELMKVEKDEQKIDRIIKGKRDQDDELGVEDDSLAEIEGGI